MSLYQVDKAIKMLTHNLDPAPFQRYQQDRDGFLEGFDLTADERNALRRADIVQLYAMGAQPFILQALGMRLSNEPDIMAYFPKYIEIVAPYGHPNYET